MEWRRDMVIQEVVAVVRDLIVQGDRAFVERHGEQGLSSAQAIHSLLADRLGGELAGRLSLGALWRDFEAEPDSTAPSVVGALEALVEADPSLAQELEVLFSEYEVAVSTPSPADSAVSRVEVAGTEGLNTEPLEGVPVVEREADRGHGAYLYGNVQSSNAALDNGQPLEHVPPDRVTELGQLDTAGTVPVPALDDLYEIVAAYPDLEIGERERIQRDLEALLKELEERSAADEQVLVGYLRRIGETEPDVLDAVLERIEADTARLGLPAALAVREMRAWLEGTRTR